MIKLVIFDLDGVLVSSKDAHYVALNKALEKQGKEFVISLEDHQTIFDGLPTKEKLKILTKTKGLPVNLHQAIYDDKQRVTCAIAKDTKPNTNLIELFKWLKCINVKIAICSNAIFDTTSSYIMSLGLDEYCDYTISNECVKECKPNSEMYLNSMVHFSVSPKETIIIEDSAVGVRSARDSEANVLTVTSVEETANLKQHILTVVRSLLGKKHGWISPTLNVLVVMAGEGRRFKEVGYKLPKPFIDIDGKPMIQRVIENLNIDANYTFVVRKEHCDKYNAEIILKLIRPNSNIVVVDELTEGACCSSLLAEKYINNDSQLIIANSDQLVDYCSIEFLYKMISAGADGGLLTFFANETKWSYANHDKNNIVSHVAEKLVISNSATCGIYYWKTGKEYVACAKEMIKKDIRTNNEFYICPVYNEAINKGKKIISYPVRCMIGLGTPEDLAEHLKK